MGGALSAQQVRVISVGSSKSCVGHTEGAAGEHQSRIEHPDHLSRCQLACQWLLHESHYCAVSVCTGVMLSSQVSLLAGLTGLLLAACAQQQRALAPVVNLRIVNPHVTATLDDWCSRHRLQAALPRQAAAIPALATDPGLRGQLAGSSSFGMGGINAHVLLSCEPTSAKAPAAASSHSKHWQRQRHWPVPLAHPLLQQRSSAAGGPGGHSPDRALCFSVSLAQARLAALRDCRVQGQLEVPTSCFLELALAAAQASCSSPSSRPVLTGLAVHAPMRLRIEHSSTLAADVVVCSLHRSHGTATVESASGARHISCAIAAASSLDDALAPSTLQNLRVGCIDCLAPKGASGWGNSRTALLASTAADDHMWQVAPGFLEAAAHLAVLGTACFTGRSLSAVASAVGSPSKWQHGWCSSEQPIGTTHNAAVFSAHAQLPDTSRLSATGVEMKPTAARRAAYAATETADASELEQSEFIYEVVLQAAAAAETSRYGDSGVKGRKQAQLAARSSYLIIEGALSPQVSSGSSRPAANCSSMIACLETGLNAASQAASGLQCLQQILSCSMSKEAVLAVLPSHTGLAECHSASGNGSAYMLAALFKVAAVEFPDHAWETQAVHPLHHSLQQCATACHYDQHGSHTSAGVIRLPLLLRHGR